LLGPRGAGVRGTAGIVALIRCGVGRTGGRKSGRDSAGSVSVKVEPMPTVLSTLSEPPSKTAKRRAMASPSPVP
jgi:hypothetical protein